MPIVRPILNFYGRYERPISSLSLVLGFVFDAITLRRVDTVFENIWILGHLVIIGIFIVLIHMRELEEGDEKNPSKAHFWYVNILQFFFGGTLSAYLVLYFRSTEISSSWPFILLLALAFIANESLKRHYVRLSFQISLFFISIYSFAIFLLPILLHKIGTEIFLLGGAISLGIITVFVSTLFYFIKDKVKKERYEGKRIIFSMILGIFALINILYFTNLIPPIPLSLKDAGVYNLIQKTSAGYQVTYEDRGWRDYFKIYPEFKLVPGMPAYVYSAVFSPKDLNLTIIHEWQHYDEIQKKWKTESIVRLPVFGGRDGGFRTYSMKSSMMAGKWRVNIKTQDGLIIGRKRFNAVDSDTTGIMTTNIK